MANDEKRESAEEVLERRALPGAYEPSPSDVAHDIIKGPHEPADADTEATRKARDEAFEKPQPDFRAESEKPREASYPDAEPEAEGSEPSEGADPTEADEAEAVESGEAEPVLHEDDLSEEA